MCVGVGAGGGDGGAPATGDAGTGGFGMGGYGGPTPGSAPAGMGVPGVGDAAAALGGSFSGQGMIGGNPYGGDVMGPPAPATGDISGTLPGMSENSIFGWGGKGLTTAANLLGFGNPIIGGMLFGAQLMADAAHSAGQPFGDIGTAGMSGGSIPNLAYGNPSMGPTFASLTNVVPSISPQQKLQEEQQKSSVMPINQVTSSVLSVPAPKMDYRNIMASRGVRALGTKAASPEWFQKGKRGY